MSPPTNRMKPGMPMNNMNMVTNYSMDNTRILNKSASCMHTARLVTGQVEQRWCKQCVERQSGKNCYLSTHGPRLVVTMRVALAGNST